MRVFAQKKTPPQERLDFYADIVSQAEAYPLPFIADQ